MTLMNEVISGIENYDDITLKKELQSSGYAGSIFTISDCRSDTKITNLIQR